jgi:hypothetical protein
MPKVVYLDRNVYDAINRMPNGSDYVALLKKFINEGRISIPSSFLVLEETLPVLTAKDKTKIDKEQKTLADLMDWRIIIRPPGELLEDAVNAWASGTPSANHYYPFAAKSKDFFKLTPEAEADLLKALQEARENYEKFRTMVKGWQDDIKSQKISGHKISFDDLWPEQSSLFLDRLIEKFHPELMNRSDKQDLLNYRAVKAHVGYGVAYELRNIIQGREAKRSDSVDHYHLVSASITDIFVTDDDALFEKLSLFKVDGLRTINLASFLTWIKGGCR